MPIPTNAPTINVIGNVKLDIDTPKIGNSLTSETILVLKNANTPPALLTFINSGPKLSLHSHHTDKQTEHKKLKDLKLLQIIQTQQ